MAHIHRAVRVPAPVGEVFAYMTDPEHLPAIWPNLIAVSNATHSPDGDQSFDWVYRMAGIRFSGHADSVDTRKDHHVVVENRSGIPSTFHWTYEPRGASTEVTLDVEYQVPRRFGGRLTQPIIGRINERDAETLLANLRRRFESAGPATVEGH